MNFKKSALASAITLATFATGAAAFDASSWEVSGFVKNETAALQGSGTFIGQQTTTDAASGYQSSLNDSGDVIKFENTAKIFVNGDLSENASLHGELNFIFDSEAQPTEHQAHMDYSQNDYLRELYIDAVFGDSSDVELRVGKQQVVWGTADGMKLLDIINPTDYREFAQNTMEDSRIPVWMAKLDAAVGDRGSLQFIASQHGINKFSGLDDVNESSRSVTVTRSNGVNASAVTHSNIQSGAEGAPFMLKGVDTIVGPVNGFVNIVPEMGIVADTFSILGGGLLGNYNFVTVDDFANQSTRNANVAGATGALGFGGACIGYYSESGGAGSHCLETIANDTNQNRTLLIDQQDDSTASTGGAASEWDPENANSVFELMPTATFATFSSFAGATSKYKVTKPKDENLNIGTRYKSYLDNGLNYSLNYLYAYDPNPYIETYWENSSGQRLSVNESTSGTGETSLTLSDGTNNYGASRDGKAGAATLVFEQKQQRIHNLGASFDYTVDSYDLPVVVRGEFLYQKDVRSPVIDRAKLSYGHLTEGLKMIKGDRFQYVLGADITVMTNMLVSGQFIQNRNLDYIDEGGYGQSTWRYTGDFASMHLSNGLQKDRENKEFYSLFLSKPFGPSQLGRWNNIFIFEEGGGKWNRFDVEYSFSDELVGSFELNNYWGDTNTQFGQMEDSSNIQVGLKYLF
jgi:hypothetical protein